MLVDGFFGQYFVPLNSHFYLNNSALFACYEDKIDARFDDIHELNITRNSKGFSMKPLPETATVPANDGYDIDGYRVFGVYDMMNGDGILVFQFVEMVNSVDLNPRGFPKGSTLNFMFKFDQQTGIIHTNDTNFDLLPDKTYSNINSLNYYHPVDFYGHYHSNYSISRDANARCGGEYEDFRVLELFNDHGCYNRANRTGWLMTYIFVNSVHPVNFTYNASIGAVQWDLAVWNRSGVFIYWYRDDVQNSTNISTSLPPIWSSNSSQLPAPIDNNSNLKSMVVSMKKKTITISVIGIGVAIAVIVLIFIYYRRRSSLKDKTLQTELMSKSSLCDADDYIDIRTDKDLIHWRMADDTIQDIRRLGNGAYAVVWLVKDLNGSQFAAKRLLPSTITQTSTQRFLKEAKLVATLKHLNIVKFVGIAWTTERDIQILFEYLAGDTVRRYLVNLPDSTGWTADKLRIATNIIEALVYTHGFVPPLIHRDVKSSNVLLTTDGVAKLSDFGASREQSHSSTMTAGVGTARWLAPEVLLASSYNQSADIYSFGVVLSELDTQKLPYQELQEDGIMMQDITIITQVALGLLRPSFSTGSPQSIVKLAKQCLSQDYRDRPTASEIAIELRNIAKSLDFAL